MRSSICSSRAVSLRPPRPDDVVEPARGNGRGYVERALQRRDDALAQRNGDGEREHDGDSDRRIGRLIARGDVVDGALAEAVAVFFAGRD